MTPNRYQLIRIHQAPEGFDAEREVIFESDLHEKVQSKYDKLMDEQWARGAPGALRLDIVDLAAQGAKE